jgi:hypothetical protein
MRKSRWPIMLGALLLVAVGVPAVRASAAAVTISAQPVRTGLTAPVSFTFAPDGRIFYGERTTGRIAYFDPGNSAAPATYFTIGDVVSPGEQGLLGLALDPNFASNHLMYAYVTRLVANQHMNEIVRIFGDGVTGASFTVLYRAPAGGAYHNGGRLKFGPDGLLYVVTGDIHDSTNSQNLTDNLGKILRMTKAGAVPPQGNPVPGTLIYAYGIRNSFGFSFDPTTGNLWESENGPECNDEINLITAGANYGWGPAAHQHQPGWTGAGTPEAVLHSDHCTHRPGILQLVRAGPLDGGCGVVRDLQHQRFVAPHARGGTDGRERAVRRLPPLVGHPVAGTIVGRSAVPERRVGDLPAHRGVIIRAGAGRPKAPFPRAGRTMGR